VKTQARDVDSLGDAAIQAPYVIYDVGANNGDDIPYYLKKAHRVVAAEANPELCRDMRMRFEEEVRDGRLVIEHCVLTAERASAAVPFYVHKTDHVRSQLARPEAKSLVEYREVVVPSRSIVALIEEHGRPHYMKLDIEGQDVAVMRQLFAAGVKPPFISAESHSIDVLATLIAVGGYDAFKVVVGSTVAQRFRNHRIATLSGAERYSFPPHSAGPFGADIPGDWMPGDLFFKQLAIIGLGWKDIHATSTLTANPQAQLIWWPHARRRLARVFRLDRVKACVPAAIRRAYRSVIPR
jgi:FkbM family methyltransferase